MFSVVLDKIYVFCLYLILDFQQYVKTGSCRRQILFGLLCLFSFWASDPLVTNFEFGPRTLSFTFYLFIESLSHLVLVILFRICFASNCCLSLKVMFVFRFISCHVFCIYLRQMSLYLFNYVSYLVVFV